MRTMPPRLVTGALSLVEFVMCAGACVPVHSRTQKSVAFSSTEAECVAVVTKVFRDGNAQVFLENFFPDHEVGCMAVQEDVLHIANNPVTYPGG